MNSVAYLRIAAWQLTSHFEMKVKLKIIAVLIMTMSGAFSLCSQTTNPKDVAFLLNLREELKLDSAQFSAVDSIYAAIGDQIAAIDKEISTISRSNMDDQARSAGIRDLNGKKKTLRESRDLSIQLQLSEEQKKNYSEKVKPSTPSVIHMGINHDRSNCNVCIP